MARVIPHVLQCNSAEPIAKGTDPVGFLVSGKKSPGMKTIKATLKRSLRGAVRLWEIFFRFFRILYSPVVLAIPKIH